MKPRNSKVDKGRLQAASQTPDIRWGSVLLRAAGLGLGTVLCVMVLLGASEPDAGQEQDSRKKIETMTPAEREQLKRNYEKFQQLTPEEKQRYQKIHEATLHHPELNRVMHSYNEWVNTLSPWEQEDLRKAGTTEERMELIRKFRAHGNRSNRRGGRTDFEMLRILDLNPRVSGMITWVHSPPPELFNDVVDMIEHSLPGPVDYPKPKNQLSDFERSLAVLKMAVPLRNRKAPDKEMRTDWPPPEVVKSIQKLLAEKKYSFRNSEEQRGFRPLSNERVEDRQRMQVSYFLTKGLLDQLINSIKQELEQFHPTDAELQKFFETELDTKIKDYLMRYPPEELQEKLKSMYFREHMPEQIRKTLRSRSGEFNQLIGEFDLKGPAFEGSLRQGVRERMQDVKERRLDGPKDRGDRPPRGRNPGEGPPRQSRDQPDA
ncbi:MAG: hypothetical protein ABIK07_17315 [Planctomycetota bacterium]